MLWHFLKTKINPNQKIPTLSIKEHSAVQEWRQGSCQLNSSTETFWEALLVALLKSKSTNYTAESKSSRKTAKKITNQVLQLFVINIDTQFRSHRKLPFSSYTLYLFFRRFLLLTLFFLLMAWTSYHKPRHIGDSFICLLMRLHFWNKNFKNILLHANYLSQNTKPNSLPSSSLSPANSIKHLNLGSWLGTVFANLDFNELKSMFLFGALVQLTSFTIYKNYQEINIEFWKCLKIIFSSSMVKFFRDNETRKTQATTTKYIKVIQHMVWFIDSLANYASARQWPSWG